MIKFKKTSQDGKGERYDALSLLKDILSCVAVTVIAGGWMLLCLFILSFMLVYFMPFHISWMLPVSIVFGLAAGAVYTAGVIKKRRKNK